jgi:hypothetical protein
LPKNSDFRSSFFCLENAKPTKNLGENGGKRHKKTAIPKEIAVV